MGFVVRRGAVGAGRDRDSHGASLTMHPGFFFSLSFFVEIYKALSSLIIDGVGEIRPC